MQDSDPSNVGYGQANRIWEVPTRACPSNSHGPRDNVYPETSHFIPALMRRLVEVEDLMVVWGMEFKVALLFM